MTNDLGATEKDLIENRVAKLHELRELGIDPYPSVSKRDRIISAVIDNKDSLINSKEEITIAGRAIAKRGHGKLVFLDIVDESGKTQGVLKADLMEESAFAIVEQLEVGDFVELSGTIFVTNAGELSVQAKEVRILTKSIRPLPEKWNGLKDVETRYRERYVDFIVNPEVKQKFYARSKIIKALRDFLVENGFMEVDTPVLQAIPGGASAKPFSTHYNAYDREVFLRIAPELYLKRLLVGGFEKIFEFARCFRNEGVDATHNPEFTNLEFYWAYADYEKLMDLTEDLIRFVVRAVNNGDLTLEIEGKKIDFSEKFGRVSFHELTKGENSDEAFKKGIAGLINPTFVTNHPADLLPLAKRNEKNSELVDSFQLIIGGIELIKAFSELNDPIDQRERFMDQAKLREKGDEEAQRLDEDFLKAIEYGMPPTAGWGLGVDRFVRVLTDSKTLREIMYFPFMKPTDATKKSEGEKC